MTLPFKEQLTVEDRNMFFFPDNIEATAIPVASDVARWIEPQIVAARRNARIDDNLLAVPLAHFFPARSLSLTASK
jgi:hypothetical protein